MSRLIAIVLVGIAIVAAAAATLRALQRRLMYFLESSTVDPSRAEMGEAAGR